MLGLLRRFDEPPMERGLRSTVGRKHRHGGSYRPSWRRRGSPATVAKAQAKRERKAAKRVRDIRLSAIGRALSMCAVLASDKRAAEIYASRDVGFFGMPSWRHYVSLTHADRRSLRWARDRASFAECTLLREALRHARVSTEPLTIQVVP